MIAIVCASAVVAAQETRPAFEVASIRPAEVRVLPFGGARILPGGRFEASQATVVDLLDFAYGLTFIYAPRVMGGPEWITTARYDIAAVPEGNPEPGRARRARSGPLHGAAPAGRALQSRVPLGETAPGRLCARPGAQ